MLGPLLIVKRNKLRMVFYYATYNFWEEACHRTELRKIAVWEKTKLVNRAVLLESQAPNSGYIWKREAR